MKNTKSLLAILLACMMIVSCFVVTTPVAATDDWDEWDGSTDTSWYNDVDTTFTLTTAAELAGLAEIVNGGAETFKNKTIYLDANIRLNEEGRLEDYESWGSAAPDYAWTPIGYYNVGNFQGTFDGQGHTISGMYAPGDLCENRPALFGYVNGATITNFTIEYSYSIGTSCPAIVAAFHSGTAPVFSNITIDHCIVESSNGSSDGAALLMCKMGGFGTFNVSNITVTNSTINGTYNSGALIGNLSGGNMTAINITGCDVTAAVNSSTASSMNGGIIGKIGSGSGTLGTLSITNCTFNPTMVNTRNFGGVIGDVCKQTVGNILFDNVDVTVDINAHGFSANICGAGAIIGYFRPNELTGKVSFKDSSISGTFKIGQNSGLIIGWQTSAGTFVAHNEIEVKDSTFDVDIITKKGSGNAQCNGGIIGLAQKAITTLTVDGLTSTNNWSYISGDTSGNQMGGLVGSATITNVNVSNTKVSDNFTIGGSYISGYIATGKYMNATFTNCVYDGKITGTSYCGDFAGRITTTVSAGNITNWSFTNCVAAGNVTATEQSGVFIGYYDPSSGNATAQNNSCPSGEFSFTNCLATAFVSGTANNAFVGIFFGRVYPRNIAIDINNVIVAGGYSATNDTYTGIISGGFSSPNTIGNTITISNLFFPAGKLAYDFNNGGNNMVASGATFWTGSTESNPEGLTKQPNNTLQTFIDATSALDFTTLLTSHNHAMVTVDDSTAIECAVPGCAKYRIVDPSNIWDEWDGTSSDDSWKILKADGAYHITSAAQLANLAAEINANITSNQNFYQSKTIKLDVNIRLNSTSDIANFANWATSAPALTWIGIGSYDSAQSKFHSFNGTFDGQGHTIEGMYCAPTASSNGGSRYAFIGIPGELVQVKNVTFNKAYVTGGGNGVGIVFGQMANTHSNKVPQTVAKDVTITNSTLKATTSGGAGAILGRTAGLIGQTLVFDNCDVSNSTLQANSYLGGIFGYHGSGDLKADDKGNDGGFTFINCDMTGNTIRANENFGGFMGGCYALAADSTAIITFRNCTSDENNHIEVTSVTAGNQSAGIVGYFNSAPKSIIIDNCSIGGEIDVLQNSAAFIGRIGTSAANADVSITVTDSTSTANLTANVMRTGINSGCIGVVIGLFQAVGGTNIADLTIDGLTCSGTIDGTAKGGNTYGIIASVGPAITNLTISNVDSTLEILGVGDCIGGLAGNITTVDTLSVSNVNIGAGVAGGTRFEGRDAISALIARIGATTTASFSNITVNADIYGRKMIGGVVGYNYAITQTATFNNVNVTATIESSETARDPEAPTTEIAGFGGILGTTRIIDATFTNCSFKGSITAVEIIGGLVGDINTTLTVYADPSAAEPEYLDEFDINICDYVFTNCNVDATLYAYHRNVGGIVGDYDPGNSGVAGGPDNEWTIGTFEFNNCVVSGSRTSANINAGGLMGRIYPRNVWVTIDHAVVLGETISSDSSFGALTGCIGNAAGADDLYEITNFYYSGMSNGKLVPSWNNGGFGVVTTCEFFTPGTDNTSGVEKQAVTVSDTVSEHITSVPSIAKNLGGSIRTGENTGLRFGFRMDEDLKVGSGDSINMGVLLIPTELLEGELTLDTDKVLNAKAKKAFTSGANYEEGSWTFTAVLVDIPEAKKDTQISARAYVQIGSVVYYSAVQTGSFNSVAALVS